MRLRLTDARHPTWSQVLGVGDEVLHCLQDLGYCQVLQNALAHTDYFTHLGDKGTRGGSHDCMNAAIIE